MPSIRLGSSLLKLLTTLTPSLIRHKEVPQAFDFLLTKKDVLHWDSESHDKQPYILVALLKDLEILCEF